MNYELLICRFQSLSNPEAVRGMSRYGINSENTLGIRIPQLRKLAFEAGKNHQTALQLWASGFHEAGILASMIDQPVAVTHEQMERWAADFDSWDSRNYVKNAVHWALRQIGKRNLELNHQAIATALQIQSLPGKTPRWNASGALRELQSSAVQKRLASN